MDGDDLYIIGEVTESQDGAAKGECRVRIKRGRGMLRPTCQSGSIVKVDY
jgi:hypothetical protein